MNKRWVLIGSLIIFFILGFLLVLPIFTDKKFVWQKISPKEQHLLALGWWNKDWINRRQITIESDFIDENLVNFPILVVIDNSTGEYDLDGGDSIRFIANDDVTQYNYCIETFNATGKTYCWVNVTSISSTNDTTFWLYYNNSAATDNQNPHDVWDDNFIAVFHMNESIGSTMIKDDTINNNNFIDEATAEYESIGKIGYGIGGNDVDIAFVNTTMDLTGLSELTIEFWLQIGAGVEEQEFLFSSRYGLTDNDIRYSFYGGSTGANDAGFVCQFDDGVEDGCINRVYTMPIGAWYYTASVFSNTLGNQVLYMNTSEVCSDPSVNFYFTGLSNYHTIGRRTVSLPHHYEGILDEFRLSSVARSAGWLSATFHTSNQTNGFLTIGAEETVVINQPPVQSNPNPPDGATDIDLIPALSVDVSDPEGNIMNATWYSNSTSIWEKFGENLSIGNGTIYQINSNFSEAYTTYWWSVNLSDGTNWNNVTYKFTTTVISNVTPSVVSCLVNFTAKDKTDSIRIFYDTNPGIDTNDNSTYIDPENCNLSDRKYRTMIIEELKENTTYYYRLYNVDTSSWYTNERNFTTKERFTTWYRDSFYDMYLINSSNNVAIVQQTGVKDPNNPLIDWAYGDQPNGIGYICVMNDSGTWRLWALNYSGTSYNRLCYFESSDGRTWNFVSDIDTSPTPARCYPNIIKVNNVYYNLYKSTTTPRAASISNSTDPSGTFTRLPNGGNIINSNFVDGDEVEVSCFFKDVYRNDLWYSSGQGYTGAGGVREPAYFLGFNYTNWLYFDRAYFLNIETTVAETGQYSEHVYMFPVQLIDGVYVGFHHFWNTTPDVIEPYLAVSRDGITFNLVQNDTMVIPLGASGAWDDSMIFIARTGTIITDGDYDYLYYNAHDNVHEDTARTTRVGRIRFRKQGLTAIEPTSSSGWFLTKPIPSRFVANFTINGNFSETNTLRIAVINASNGQVYENFSFADFTTITTNSTSITPMWGGRNLSNIPEGDFQLNFSFSGEDGQLFSISMDKGDHYPYKPERKWQEVFSGWHVLNNISNYKQVLQGYHTFGSITSFQEVFSGYHTFGNISQFNKVFSGYHSFGNISNYQLVFSGWHSFSNVSTYKQVFSGYHTFANVTKFQQIFSGYHTFSNVSNYQEVLSGWHILNNISSYKKIISGYHILNNISNYQEVFSGWHTFANVSEYQQVFSGYHSFGSVLSWSNIIQGWHRLNNVSQNKLVFTGYHTFGNTSVIGWEKIISGWHVLNNITEYNKVVSGWHSFNNISQYNEVISGYHTFGHLQNWSKILSGWHVLNNISKYQKVFLGYHSFGNVSTYKQVLQGWHVFENTSVIGWEKIISGWHILNNITTYNKIFDGWHTFENITSYKKILDGWHSFGSLRSWNKIIEGYHTFGNITASKKVFSGWHSFNNVSKYKEVFLGWHSFSNIPNYLQIFSGNHSFGNVSVVGWSKVLDGWHVFGNITNYSKIFSGWHVLNNVSKFDKIVTGWHTFGHIYRWQKILQGWHSFGNVTPTQKIFSGWHVFKNTTKVIQILNEQPSNGSVIFVMRPWCGFELRHPYGKTMNYTVYIGDSLNNTSYNISYGVNVKNGTYRFEHYMVQSYKDYYWRVYVTDGIQHENKTFYFTVTSEPKIAPSTPDIGLLGMLLALSIAFFVLKRKRRKRENA